ADVQDLERRAELLDAPVEIAADRPKLLANPELLLLEAPDLGLLLRRQEQRRRILALLLELGEPALRLGKLVLQTLLRCAELRVRLAAERLDAREGPRERRAALEPDQVRAARQVVERVDDEVAVARERRENLLAEEALRAYPQTVAQHVDVGDEDDVRVVGGRQMLRAGVVRSGALVVRFRIGRLLGVVSGRFVIGGFV